MSTLLRWLGLAALAFTGCTAASPRPAPPAERDAPPSAPVDSRIAGMVREISPERIEATIRKLVSFHTRHTLSETESDTRGIGAARRFIASELQRASQEAGGRLVVTLDEFEQPAAPPDRPQPTPVVNVVATLPGRLTAAKDRLYVLTG